MNDKNTDEEKTSFIEFALGHRDFVTAHGQMPLDQGINAVLSGLARFNRPAFRIEVELSDDGVLSTFVQVRQDTHDQWVKDVLFVLKEGAKEALFFLPEEVRDRIASETVKKTASSVR